MRLLLFLPFLLIGCANMEVIQGRTNLPENPVIVAHGDSLTAGATGDPANPYAPYTDQFPKSWTVFNTGNPGENGKQIRDRFETDVIARNPDVVIIWCCQNSLNIGEPADRIWSNYILEMIARAEGKGIDPVLITPGYWPRIEIDGQPEYKKEQLKLLQNYITDYAEKTGTAALLIKKYDSDDGTHPNAEQYKKIGEKIKGLIDG